MAVHPDDERHRALIGKKVVLPLLRHEIPIIADEMVDREFGTGAVKITPAHDPNDFELGRRHHLPEIDVMTDDGPGRVDISEGEMWVLPRSMPHSPQRDAGSIGLVIERVREVGTLEKFRWYCANCHGIVHEVELQVTDIVADLPPVFKAFYDSEDARTCPTCGTLHPGKG